MGMRAMVLLKDILGLEPQDTLLRINTTYLYQNGVYNVIESGEI